jgi:steroid delta-isomerase-like uncharacterized protein
MSLENKIIVRRLYEEIWNKRKIGLMTEILSPSHALHDPVASGSQVGPESYQRRVEELTTAFPDLRFSIEDTVEEKDKFAVFWVISGTHQNEFMGVPATGKKISVEGITIHHLSKGRILDSFVEWDALGLMRQLGVTPARIRSERAVSQA